MSFSFKKPFQVATELPLEAQEDARALEARERKPHRGASGRGGPRANMSRNLFKSSFCNDNFIKI